ncbi:MAG: methyltransferase domain-containing protein [Luteitalea sp.]|nr:methyltransferase domain-containing protein [Luteitalea sp.]
MTPYQHLNLLRHHERALPLRSMIRDTVHPGMKVLDAGCGVGLLAMWSIDAGADRVVGVDVDDVSLARRLATENGMASRIDFIQADLWNFDLPAERNTFDALLAMVYLNDPRRDEGQAKLVFALKQKFLAARGSVVPNCVRYYARACEWPQQDHKTRQARLQADVTDLEGRYALKLQGLCAAVSAQPWAPQFPDRRPDGRLDLSQARLLSDPERFAEIDYTKDPAPCASSLEIQADVPGIFNTIVWTQELWFEERLIFSNESVSWIVNPHLARSGSKYTIRLDAAWRERNLATLVEGR